MKTMKLENIKEARWSDMISLKDEVNASALYLKDYKNEFGFVPDAFTQRRLQDLKELSASVDKLIEMDLATFRKKALKKGTKVFRVEVSFFSRGWNERRKEYMLDGTFTSPVKALAAGDAEVERVTSRKNSNWTGSVNVITFLKY